MEVTTQHQLIFFLSHVFGQLPYSLRAANGKYEIFESRLRLVHTKLLAAVIFFLQIYVLLCAFVSNFAYVPDLFSKTVFIFAYVVLMACALSIFWKTITKRKIFRFWLNNISAFQFDDQMTDPRKSFDLLLVVADLLWLLILSIYDIFFFRSSERFTESPHVCQIFYFLDFISVVHFTTLWEMKIFCWSFMLLGNVVLKFYKDTNKILREGRKRFSKRFWLNYLKTLRVKDLQIKDFVDFLHSFYMPVVFGEILWGFSTALVTLSARVGIDAMIQCVWTIYVFWDITVILTFCQSLEKEAEKTAQKLHQLFVTCDDIQIKEEVELYSLQALHRKVEFNALGFFKLDFTLLYSIIGSLTSYVVILSQFQDESSKAKVSCKRVV